MTAAEHDHSFGFPVGFEYKGEGLTPFGLIDLARACGVELALVGRETYQISYLDVLADGERGELTHQDFLEIRIPLGVCLFSFHSFCGWSGITL